MYNFLEQSQLKHIDHLFAKWPDENTIVDRIVKDILEDGEARSRIKSCRLYDLSNCKQDAHLLVALAERMFSETAESVDHELIRSLFCAIGQVDSAETHAFLVSVVHRSVDVPILASAIDGLNREEKHYDPLVIVKVLQDSADVDVQRACIGALWKDSSPTTREVIVTFQHHEDECVRLSLLQTLSLQKNTKALVEQFLRDPSDLVREEAEYTLSNYVL